MLSLKKDITFKLYVVGVGGTGSNLVSPLSRLLQFSDSNKLTLIDGDIYEDKNKKNQNIGDRQIGKSKSEAMAKLIINKFPEVEVNYVDRYIKSEDELIEILDVKYNQVPILVSCVDNNSTRKIFHNVFYNDKIRNIIYIDSGNGTDDRVGQVVIGYKECNTVKLKPVGDSFKEILEDEDTVEKATSCAATMNEKPQNVATNFMAAAILFNCINNIISFKYICGNKIFFNCEECALEKY